MKTISSSSWIYKLYALQLIRTTSMYTDSQIAERSTNICDVGSRACKQVCYKFFEVGFIALFFSVITWLIMVPLLTFGFYLFTDNPFIIWFGGLGEATLVAEAAFLVIVGVVGILILLALGLQKSSASLGFTGFVSTWISNKFEGICTPLKIEVKNNDSST